MTGKDKAKNQLPLYQLVLGTAWPGLPGPIREMHQPRGDRWQAAGIARVERGSGWLSRLIGRLIGFPETGENIPVQVVFELTAAGEIWTRSFAGKSFHSYQYAAHGRAEKLLYESFGALNFGIALVPEGDALNLVLRRWSVLGIRLPLVLAPVFRSCEFVEQDRFHFYVEITHPLAGLIVHYQGHLTLNKDQ
jgi:hypothetical protein